MVNGTRPQGCPASRERERERIRRTPQAAPPQRRMTRLDVWLEEQDERLAPGGAWEPAARLAFAAALFVVMAYLAGHAVYAVWG